MVTSVVRMIGIVLVATTLYLAGMLAPALTYAEATHTGTWALNNWLYFNKSGHSQALFLTVCQTTSNNGQPATVQVLGPGQTSTLMQVGGVIGVTLCSTVSHTLPAGHAIQMTPDSGAGTYQISVTVP